MEMRDRWKIAQESEKEFWKQFNKEDILKEAKKYKLKADNLLEDWKKYIKINKNTKILQVGGAGFDVINQIDVGKRYAIDPLADFYKERFNIDYREINFKKGVGEEIPYSDKFFDIVILANVLDHVSSPEKVISEARRVLKKDGLLYLDIYVATKRFIKIADIWGKLQKKLTGKIFNIHHPFMFSSEDSKKLIKKFNFQIIHENIGEDYFQETKDLNEVKQVRKKDKKLKIRILAYLGMYGDILYNALAKKKIN